MSYCTLELHGLIGNNAAPVEGWVRPADWLPLPVITDTDEQFSGLYAVWDSDSNFISLSASGNYTVDWGDGTVQNITGGVQAYHEYDYADVAFDGTLTTRGYKQAIVTVTPQSGQNLTALNIKLKHNQAGLVNNYASGWLDIVLSIPNCTASGLVISSISTTLVDHTLLEQVTIKSIGGLTTLERMFSSCRALESVPLFNTSSVTNMAGMFATCTSLKSVPLFITDLVTDTQSMFSGCSALKTVPLFNTSAVTSMGSMFSGCFLLESVPIFDTSSVTNMQAFFQSCTSLKTVPLLNLGSTTSMQSMFSGCSALQSIPLFNTSLVANWSNTFISCISLERIPALSVSAVTVSAGFSNIFSSCRSLSKIEASEFKQTFSVANLKLSASALDEIYTNLPTVVGQTITVTGNFGTSGHNPSIATAKGWTVTA